MAQAGVFNAAEHGVHFSPDGRWLLVASDYEIWSTETG
jgi:hypothetical protein